MNTLETTEIIITHDLESSLDEIATHYSQHHDENSKSLVLTRGKEFVYFIARKFLYRGEHYLDLVQVGMIGMLHALDHYRPEQGVRFLTYAMHIIVGEIRHHLRDHSSLVKIPRRIRDRYNQIQRHIREFSEKNTGAPNLQQLCVLSGFTEDEILEVLESSESFRVYSLDATVQNNDLDQPMRTVPFIATMHMAETDIGEPILNRESIHAAMDGLDRKEKKIIYLSYYLNLSQSEVASRMGLSQAHISRMMIQILGRLRRALNR